MIITWIKALKNSLIEKLLCPIRFYITGCVLYGDAPVKLLADEEPVVE